jgi:hypothetical protein
MLILRTLLWLYLAIERTVHLCGGLSVSCNIKFAFASALSDHLILDVTNFLIDGENILQERLLLFRVVIRLLMIHSRYRFFDWLDAWKKFLRFLMWLPRGTTSWGLHIRFFFFVSSGEINSFYFLGSRSCRVLFCHFDFVFGLLNLLSLIFWCLFSFLKVTLDLITTILIGFVCFIRRHLRVSARFFYRWLSLMANELRGR